MTGTKFTAIHQKPRNPATQWLFDGGDVREATLFEKNVGLPAIQWDLTPSQTAAEGLMYWNADDGTLNLGMPGGNVNLQLGQEMFVPKRPKNVSGGVMPNGSLVFVSGATGAVPEIELADASTEALSNKTIGMCTEDIADQGRGYVTVFGLVRGSTAQPIDTSTFTAGDVLWLSETAGEFQNTPPASPAHAVSIGIVIRVHATEGEISVRVINGFEVFELHDVDSTLSAPTDNSFFYWNDGNSLWESKLLTGGDLTGFTQGRIPYSAADGSLIDSANLLFDDTALTVAVDTNITDLLNVEGRVAKIASVGNVDPGGVAFKVVISGDYAYLANGTDGLRIIDISDPTTPVSVGNVDPGGTNFGIAVQGRYAYLAGSGAGLHTIDISDPTTPVSVGNVDPGGSATHVSVSGSYAYLANGTDGFYVVDISDPTTPIVLSHIATTLADYVATDGNFVYLADGGSGMRIIDVSDPTAPAIIATIDPGGQARSIAIQGNYAYLANNDDGLRIIDITDPFVPVAVGNVVPASLSMHVTVSGDYAYLGNLTSGLFVIDISDPTTPVVVDSIDPGAQARGTAISGNYVYLANHAGGMYVIDVSGASISNMEIGTAKISHLQVMSNAILDQSLKVKGGLSVGIHGALIGGTLVTRSGRSVKKTRVTTTYTILVTDHHIFANSDAGDYTVTLPVGINNTQYIIRNTGTSGNQITLAPDGAENLLGVNSGFDLYDGEDLSIIYCDSDGWF